MEKISKRRSSLHFKKTSYSHLFFALLNKPGIIFMIPGYILLVLSVIVFFILGKNILQNISFELSIYSAIRESMLNGALTWLTMIFSFILSIQFFTLNFIINQSKKNYEETYKTLNAILNEIKKSKSNL